MGSLRSVSAGVGFVLAFTPWLSGCETQVVEHLPIDWDRPIVDGRIVTAEEAAHAMAFQVVVPHIDGGPQRIMITPPESAPPRFRNAAIMFSGPKLGRFNLIESMSQTTQQELEGLSRCSGGCEGNWELVDLPEGIRGVLFEGPATTGVIWLRKETRFDLVGPTETFDALAAILVASVTARTEPVRFS